MKSLTKTRLLRATTAFLLLTCAALFMPASTFADNGVAKPPKQLLMSFNEYLTSNNTLDGQVTLTGAIADRGSRHEDFTVTSANKDGSQVVVSGTSTITVTGGTIKTQWTGTIYFDNANFDHTLLAYIEGVESITGGTGAYAGATGKGTFESTIDYTTGNALGVFEAKVQMK